MVLFHLHTCPFVPRSCINAHLGLSAKVERLKDAQFWLCFSPIFDSWIGTSRVEIWTAFDRSTVALSNERRQVMLMYKLHKTSTSFDAHARRHATLSALKVHGALIVR